MLTCILILNLNLKRYANVLKPQQLKQETTQKKEESKSSGVLV